MEHRVPRRPQNLDPLAADILLGLCRFEEAAQLVLGGQFALKHYLDGRGTHDIDAWWSMEAGAETRQAVVDRLRQVMGEVAEMRDLVVTERAWGEVLSVELRRGLGEEQKAVFSVQVARRSLEIDPPLSSPWPPIRIETLRDNIGSKMSALVNRGLPRDFVDIECAVAEGLVSTEECWDLWMQKNPGGSISDAKAAVRRHLNSVELRRPSASLPPSERLTVAMRRGWVARELVGDGGLGDFSL